MPDEKKPTRDTQVLTRSGFMKKVLLGLVTVVVGLSTAGILWVGGTILMLQKDMTTIRVTVKATKKKIEDRFKERPEDMAIWERLHKQEERIRKLELKGEYRKGLWEGFRKAREKYSKQDDDKVIEKPKPQVEVKKPREIKKPEKSKDDARIYREKHLRPWIQQQQSNQPPQLMLNRKK